MGADLSEAFDVACANLGASLDHLVGLLELLERIGGYMSAEDQARLAAARAFVAERGRRR